MKKLHAIAALALGLLAVGLAACADDTAYVPTNQPVNSSTDVDECPRADGQPCK